jgi:hypothetical protein
MDLQQLLQGQFDESILQQLGQQVGAQDTQQVSTAASGIMQALLGGLASNAQQPQGASAIFSALQNDHDGSIIEDIMGLVTGNSSHGQASNGSNILGHILGGQQPQIANQIGQASGLDAGSIMQMMIKLAPMLMGVLGKTQNQNGLDASGLASMLIGSAQQQQQQQSPFGAILSGFLDKDKDGSIMDDLAGSVGQSLLGKFFGK